MRNDRKKRTAAGLAIEAGPPVGARGEAPRWRAWGIQVGLVAGAALALYAGLASWSDLSRVIEVARSFPPRAAASVGLLVGAGLLLRAARWHVYTRVLRLGVPAGPSMLAFVAGFAFTATPGKVGEVVKSFLLKRRFATPVALTAASLVVERVTDLLAVLMLAVIGIELGFGVGSGWVLGASALALAFALAFLLSVRLQRALLGALARVPGLARVARALPALLDSSRQLLTPVPLAVGLALALAAWSCEALALEVVLHGLGADVPRTGAFFAFAASSLLGVLSMLPGGLGGFEATMVVILGQLGVEPSTAVAATLLFRLGTLWLVSLLGLIVLAGWVVVYGRGVRNTSLR